ncbi:MAG: helicase, partial [Candidatus Aenigmatarchaeota archaeon]
MSQLNLKPLIVQSDLTILLETNSPLYEQARDKISLFAELIKSPEFVHTYKITPLSLWNAASAGVKFDEIVETLKTFSRYPVPENVFTTIKEVINRYGKLKILKGENEKFLLFSEDDILLTEIFYNKKIRPYIEERIDRNHLLIKSPFRGHIKQALIGIGFPVEDIAGYKDGDPLEINMVEYTRKTNKPFRLYPYQEEAVKIFYANNSPRGGSGVIVLPCGAGKTIVGLKILTLLKTHTLILVTNATAAEQWKEELLDKTDIDESMIGQYYAECKEIKPITIATYQIIVYRKKKGEEFIHYDIFYKKNWGFIIYDEVHLLPAPVFRITAELQSKRRLGLTATLVREDGKEADVFALIGPKKYDVPWKE